MKAKAEEKKVEIQSTFVVVNCLLHMIFCRCLFFQTRFFLQFRTSMKRIMAYVWHRLRNRKFSYILIKSTKRRALHVPSLKKTTPT